jgi:3D (Asp-Asp-Asp) domain-containing protein
MRAKKISPYTGRESVYTAIWVVVAVVAVIASFAILGRLDARDEARQAIVDAERAKEVKSDVLFQDTAVREDGHDDDYGDDTVRAEAREDVPVRPAAGVELYGAVGDGEGAEERVLAAGARLAAGDGVAGWTELGVYQIYGYNFTDARQCGKRVADGITASGVLAREGVTVAMYGAPFGTRIWIEGIGLRVVEDRGVGKGVVDVAFDSDAECYLVTRRARVWVVGEGKS